MADGTQTPAADTQAASVAEFEFPQFDEGSKFTFDCAEMPADVRLDFLKGAVRQYVANRLNSVQTRHNKDAAVMAWAAYDAATKADPLQTAVPKPEGDRPAAPNFREALDRAFDDLRKGNVRKVGAEPKARQTRDPLVATVTEVVVREVFASRKAENAKYTFLEAKKEVGSDGVAYLNKLIEAKVAGGADRTALEKMRDEKYIKPARAMLGLDTNKKLGELPSIL